MWNPLAALKDVIEHRRLLLQRKRELKKSNELLKDATIKHVEADSLQIKAMGERQVTENEVEKLKEQIQQLQAKLNHQTTLLQSQITTFEKYKSEAETALESKVQLQTEHEKIQQVYSKQKQSLEEIVRNKHHGPEKKIKQVNARDSSKNSNRIHALGDLHGWAPGLIGYLTEHNLAKIEISGQKIYSEDEHGKISLNVDAMNILFPDLKEYLQDSKDKKIPEDETVESFLHAGLLGQKAGTFNPRASYCGVDVEWIAKDEFFIQVGDVFDRADHSELSAEILRQMILQAPAHVFVLVGNHEEFLLLDQFSGWFRNEKKWGYRERHGGNTRTIELINPTDDLNFDMEEEVEDFLLNDMYLKYKQSAAVLYFTQYFAQKKLAGTAYDDVPGFTSKELQSFSDRILSGTWDAYEAASEFHQLYLDRLTSKPISFPGGIAGLGIGDSWFMHAEPNGLRKYLSSLSKDQILELKTPTHLGDRDLLILPMDAIKESDGRFSSPCTELFWARDASSGFDALDSRFAHISSEIIKVLPGVRNIIHGHSPVPLKLDRNTPHTYLGRLLATPVTPENGDIRVYNIDEGMTPVYQYDIEGNRIHLEAMPKGLQVPKILEEFHTTGGVVSEDDLWDLSHMFIDGETVPFTIGYELALNDTPDQYLPTGPGKIRVNPVYKDRQPEFVCTKEEQFRENPTEFSWLRVRDADNLSNPLKDKQPPPDGLYRVQNKTKGSFTLAENLMYLLSMEAFGKKTGIGKANIESYSGARAKVELGNYFGVENFRLWGKLGENIVKEGINSAIQFFTIQSTSKGNSLNLSALNLGKGSFVLTVSNLNPHGGQKTSKTVVKNGSYLTQTIALIPPSSEVQISMAETTSGESTVIFEGIFGSSKTKPIHSTEKPDERPPVYMLMKEPFPDMSLWDFTRKYKDMHTEKRNLMDSKTVKEGMKNKNPSLINSDKESDPISPEVKPPGPSSSSTSAVNQYQKPLAEPVQDEPATVAPDMEKTPEPEKGPDPGTPGVSDEDAKQPEPFAEGNETENHSEVDGIVPSPETAEMMRQHHQTAKARELVEKAKEEEKIKKDPAQWLRERNEARSMKGDKKDSDTDKS